MKEQDNVSWDALLMLLILATLDISKNEENGRLCFECKTNKLKNNQFVCDDCRDKVLKRWGINGKKQ